MSEDHNAKWTRDAQELATEIIDAVEMEILYGLENNLDTSDIAKAAARTVFVRLIPRFRQEAEISSEVDEWAYRTSMDYLNLIEVMAGMKKASKNV